MKISDCRKGNTVKIRGGRAAVSVSPDKYQEAERSCPTVLF